MTETEAVRELMRLCDKAKWPKNLAVPPEVYQTYAHGMHVGELGKRTREEWGAPLCNEDHNILFKGVGLYVSDA